MREVSNAYGACTVRTFFSAHPSLAPVTPRGYMKYIEYLSCKNQQDQTPCDICECDKVQIHNPQLWAIAHSPLLFVEPRPRFSSQMDCSDKPSLLTACAELWHELETDLNSKWQRTTWRSPPLRFKTLRDRPFSSPAQYWVWPRQPHVGESRNVNQNWVRPSTWDTVRSVK